MLLLMAVICLREAPDSQRWCESTGADDTRGEYISRFDSSSDGCYMLQWESCRQLMSASPSRALGPVIVPYIGGNWGEIPLPARQYWLYCKTRRTKEWS
jgi:hypothetical protein